MSLSPIGNPYVRLVPLIGRFYYCFLAIIKFSFYHKNYKNYPMIHPLKSDLDHHTNIQNGRDIKTKKLDRQRARELVVLQRISSTKTKKE